MIRSATNILAATAALFIACENAEQPLAPAWGKERCGHCSMVVDDRRFAAQAINQKHDRLFFDDPGCLASYLANHPQTRHAWLLSQGQWVEAARARFDSGAKSPMDYGFVVTPTGKLDWSAVQRSAQALNSGVRP